MNCRTIVASSLLPAYDKLLKSLIFRGGLSVFGRQRKHARTTLETSDRLDTRHLGQLHYRFCVFASACGLPQNKHRDRYHYRRGPRGSLYRFGSLASPKIRLRIGCAETILADTN